MNHIQIRLQGGDEAVHGLTSSNKEHGDSSWRQIGHMISCSTTIQAFDVDHGEITLLLDGRIFNLEELNRMYGRSATNAATAPNELDRILIDIYLSYGIDFLVHLLEGTYVMFLLDQRVTCDEALLYVVQDPTRTRPLYIDSTGFSLSTIAVPGYSLYTDLDGGLLYNRQYLVNHTWSKRKHHCRYFPIPRMNMLCCANNLNSQLNDIFLHRLHQYIGAKSITEDMITVIHVRLDRDMESTFINNLLQQVHDIKVVDIVCDRVPDPSVVLEEIQKHRSNLSPVRIFVSSGLMEIERSIHECYKESTMSAYYELQEVASKISTEVLIPTIVEPYRECGLDVEFPFLDYTWLKTYLSIPHSL